MTGNEFDRSTVNPQREVARVFPPEFADALRSAYLSNVDQRRMLAEVDELTDELVRRGLCRPRHELSNRF